MMKHKLWPKTKTMQISVVAFILSILISLFSMGFLGIGLFYIASPIITILLPNIPSDINTWSGGWVWPTMIALPILWSCSFLIAGSVYLYLEKLDWTNLTLKTSYIVILLLWNLLIWLLLLIIVTPVTS